MRKSTLIELASTGQLLGYLLSIQAGRADDYDDWVLEGLQDKGLIDHQNALTEKAKEYLRRS